MAQIHVQQIANYLENVYGDKIDFSDVTGFDKNTENGRTMLVSRALNAFAIQSKTGCDIIEAANSITDGTDDNGIDAIYYDENQKNFIETRKVGKINNKCKLKGILIN